MLFRTVKFTNVNETVADNIKLWHERIGHIYIKALRELSRKGIIDETDFSDSNKVLYDACQSGK